MNEDCQSTSDVFVYCLGKVQQKTKNVKWKEQISFSFTNRCFNECGFFCVYDSRADGYVSL